MSFNKIIEEYSNFDFDDFFSNIDKDQVIQIINKEHLSIKDFLTLLSPIAKPHLETMAKRAQELTFQYFGHTLGVYIPLYISNYCSNNCLYCGFSARNKISRKKLNYQEMDEELQKIAETGMKHILLLTGEAPEKTDMEYLKKSIQLAKKYFDSVSIEIFPMSTENYKILKNEGVDGLTVYQETYNRELYKKVHLSGKKADYDFRLGTPERGCKAGFRSINIGALFGLGDIYKEAFISGLHVKYLMDKYLETEISISMPRLNAAEGGFKALNILDDETYVQFLLAYRIFLPRMGINVSTREFPKFRDNLIGLGITKFSAGSKTEVGGYAHDDNKETAQFEISDDRSAAEVFAMIKKKGYQPVFKDWEQF